MSRRKCFMVLMTLLLALLTQPLASAAEPTKSVVYRIQKTYEITNPGTVAASNVVAFPFFIFDNHSVWAIQQVLSENIWFSDALSTYEIIRTDDNRAVRASLGSIGAGESKMLFITQIVRVDYVDPGLTPDMVKGSIPAAELRYTQAIDHLWESDNPTLDGKAHELTDNYPNYYDKARRIYDFVRDYLENAEYAEEHSALWAYTNRKGDCSEHTHLFITLARAVGIPAKHVSGYGYNTKYGNNLDAMGHAWSIAYLPAVGWVPFDTRWASPEWNFCELSPDHLVLTSSDGTNLVEDTQIKIYPEVSRPSYTYSGPNPNLTVKKTAATIVREVAVEVTLDAAPQIQDGTWTWYATVKNVGTKTIENIRVRLQVDQTYFEVPAVQTIDSLATNWNRTVSFDVGVKDIALERGVENSTVAGLATYDSPYGTFAAEGARLASVPARVIPTETMNLLLIALIAVAVVSAIAVAAARR